MGISVTLNVAWLPVPDRLARGFNKMLIYWDFHPDTTISRVFWKERLFSEGQLWGCC